VVETAKRLMDTSKPLGHIMGATCSGGFTPLSVFADMAFGNAMSLMLTIAERDGSHSLDHAVMVSMLSICMAKKLRLSDKDMNVAGLAGLLHDVGELYIDPVYLTRGKRLRPHEWAHIVVHPRVGQMLISQFEAYPPGVGRAVAEHHERFDGSGYPRRISGNEISIPGQAVSVAEMIAGVLAANRPLERADLALKIIPGEHAHPLLSAISAALHFSRHTMEQGANEVTSQRPDNTGESVDQLFGRMSSSLDRARKLLADAPEGAKSAKALLEQAIERIKTVQRACISIGMDAYLNQSQIFGDASDQNLMFEKEVSTREIQWRMRGIARDLALQSGAKDENSIFSGLIDMLDDQAKTEVAEPALS